MIKKYSPWIHQLNRTREEKNLNENKNTDVLIVGAGISGIMTAYFTLRDTNRKVIVVDAGKVAHGSTGHNAGQLTTYFERPLTDIAHEFGVDMACNAQRDVESSWILLSEILAETGIDTKVYEFTGYAGLTSLKQTLLHLADNITRLEGGLPIELISISEDAYFINDIPSIYKEAYNVLPKKDIMSLLETHNHDYTAMLSYKKGCTNSAVLTEKLVEYMQDKYGDRLEMYENSKVNIINLSDNKAETEINEYKIISERVILCTNGFEKFTINNNILEDDIKGNQSKLDKNFHEMINQRVNYMSAYLSPLTHPPIAISYFPKDNIESAGNDTATGEIYYYATRRPYEVDDYKYNLISTGGPEKILKEEQDYDTDESCNEEIVSEIDKFLHENYNKHPAEKVEYKFCWHGLTGYTDNGIRRIGEDPRNKVLMYNLGCNGIGIMPSIYGASKIAKILNGEILEKSIFDIN